MYSVDFPAPVDPAMTTIAGDDSSRSRGSRCSSSWVSRRRREASASVAPSIASGRRTSATSRRRSRATSKTVTPSSSVA
ncbi:Uncharacterised protein [Mycobacteroides abscessus]|nr:Uncharacterised protein [Mycobacteroides abscessus]